MEVKNWFQTTKTSSTKVVSRTKEKAIHEKMEELLHDF
jgi:hypothetical protein